MNIIKRSNSCIFTFLWDESNPDMLKFMERLYGIPALTDIDSCSSCGRLLSVIYVYIIEMLEENGLLPKSFVPMCCYCNILACIGFHIPDEWEGTHIGEGYSQMENTSLIHVSGFDTLIKEHFSFELRIHNVDLALKTGRISNDVGFH